MKGKRPFMVLAIGLALGLGSSYMVYRYLDQAHKAAQPIPMTSVVSAVRDIPQRTLLTKDMIVVQSIPASAKVPEAIADPNQVVGKVSKLPISHGEQILSSKLFGDRDQSGLAFVVPPGKRAVAVAVNEVVSTGGMIEPGDFVDVVAVIDTKAPTSSSAPQATPTPAPSNLTAVAQYILQNQEVLAVAQQLEGDTPDSAMSKAGAVIAGKSNQGPAKQDSQIDPAAHSVTLAVAPEDVEKLMLAEDKGHIRLVVRPYGDDSTIKIENPGLFVDLQGIAALKGEPTSSH